MYLLKQKIRGNYYKFWSNHNSYVFWRHELLFLSVSFFFLSLPLSLSSSFLLLSTTLLVQATITIAYCCQGPSELQGLLTLYKACTRSGTFILTRHLNKEKHVSRHPTEKQFLLGSVSGLQNVKTAPRCDAIHLSLWQSQAAVEKGSFLTPSCFSQACIIIVKGKHSFRN